MISVTIGMYSQNVPLNQPSEPGLKCRLPGVGGGGTCTCPGCSTMVSGHQISNTTTITVVICIMRSALPLDS